MLNGRSGMLFPVGPVATTDDVFHTPSSEGIEGFAWLNPTFVAVERTPKITAAPRNARMLHLLNNLALEQVPAGMF
jgi:hypothetical protein